MEKITDYLISERKQKPEMTAKVTEPFAKHSDIRAELERWIDLRSFPEDSPITVEGYTAKAISKLAPFMDGVGIYNFLISLREHPENAKKIIAAGFPRK